MIGDHHGRTARRATLLASAADEIPGTHRSFFAVFILFNVAWSDTGGRPIARRFRGVVGFWPEPG
jgi:hypothetical protein